MGTGSTAVYTRGTTGIVTIAGIFVIAGIIGRVPIRFDLDSHRFHFSERPSEGGLVAGPWRLPAEPIPPKAHKHEMLIKRCTHPTWTFLPLCFPTTTRLSYPNKYFSLAKRSFQVASHRETNHTLYSWWWTRTIHFPYWAYFVCCVEWGMARCPTM